MSTSINQEVWEAEVGGQVYQADLAELASWVADGGLQPEDKVRRGNLRWIEARKVPLLIPHFNAKRDGSPPPPVVVTTTNAAETSAQSDAEEPTKVSAETKVVASGTQYFAAQPSQLSVSPKDTAFCVVHRDVPTVYVCDDCGQTYCKACPSSYGGSVKICPGCGALCKPKNEVKAAKQKEAAFQQASANGFGFGDLGAAIAYPFRFRTSLFFGSIMYVFFTLGQSATALGGIFMFAASICCLMLANTLTFGILAHTADEFSQGNIDGDFMPRFDDFSIWDDVVHPFFLSIGAYLASFGPFFVIAGIGVYMVFSSIAAQQQSVMSDIEKLPGTPYYSAKNTADQTKEFNKILGDTKKQNDERLQQQADIANGTQTQPTGAADTEDQVMKANELIEKNRKAQLESALGKTPETRAKEQSEFIARFLSLAAPIVVLAAIALLWGLFYFPAACAVAGYTRSFTAAINPIVGLDTIKRLGFDYIKLLFMGFLLLLISGFVTMLLGLIFMPFDLPGMGNIPVKIVGGVVSFYFWIVFSCLIGFILFKSADKLKLPR